jgi:hypothetical protein
LTFTSDEPTGDGYYRPESFAGMEFLAMSSEVTVREVRFASVWPWLRLGGAWGCALAPQQLALTCAAVLLLLVLNALLGQSPISVPMPLAVDWSQPGLGGWEAFAAPLRDVLHPLALLVSGTPGWWRHLLSAAAAFAVWSAVGVAVCRCTAIQFGRDENPSLVDAIGYTRDRLTTVCLAPLIPLGSAAALCAIIALLALPAWIPALGTLWLIVLAPILCVLSLAAAFILLLLPILWPLMIAATSADDSDPFDAFSRSVSLVAARVWSTLALVVLATLMTAITLEFLMLLAGFAQSLAGWSADWTTGEKAVVSVRFQVGWWAAVVVRGVMASLFWTLSTIVYLFLREAVDGKPTHQLAGFDEPLHSHDPYPVVGLPALHAPSTTAE